MQTIRKTQHDPLNHKQTQDRRKWQFQIPHYDIRLEQRKLQGHSGIENVGQVAASALSNRGQTVSPSNGPRHFSIISTSKEQLRIPWRLKFLVRFCTQGERLLS